MKSTIYEIPDRFFAGYRVTVPFRCKVIYEMKEGKAVVHDFQLSANCLRCISNTAGLVDHIENEITEVENGGSMVHKLADYAFGNVVTK
ncbi:MAG TPA: hypothetical protein VHL77_06180 [Ferruginibacter sp.]|jgi:hypothetical protein|nr:hypothetical protein [Ferruginibacter sp.]